MLIVETAAGIAFVVSLTWAGLFALYGGRA